MGILDGMLSQIGSSVNVQAIAERVGLPADKVESAIGALGIAHSQPSDTVQTAANASGVSADKVSEIMNQLGGEAAVSKFASLLGHKGGGNPLSGGLSGLFGDQ